MSSEQSSAELSRAIYERLGADGLAARTTPEWDQRTVEFVQSLLVAGQRILDIGCGYGRIAVPLNAAGYEVVGLDISEHMLDAARRRAVDAGCKIAWHVGDLCCLPFDDQSFDVVLCLWLTFHELLQESEQTAALKEMLRVLRPGGIALLDGPPFREEIEDEPPLESNTALASSESVNDGPVVRAFRELMQQVGVRDFEVFVDDCPGRPRYFLRFGKPADT